MKDSFRTGIRLLSLALISTLALTLAACGGGGSGGSGTGTTGSSGGTGNGGSTGQVVETCDGGNSTNANAIAPCMTVTGLASGSSVTVSDGTDSLTETSDGTYTFPALAFVGNGNGGEVAPTVTFSVTAGSCQLSDTSGDHASVLCAAYPAVSPTVPTVTTLPGVNSATVIGTPVIVPVMFQTANGTTGNQTNDVTFLQQLTASKVWGLLSQYGVSAASVESAVVDSSPGFQVSPFSIVTAQDIDNEIQANASTWDPSLTANTVFVFFLPPNVMDTYADGMTTSSGLPNAAGSNGQVTVGSTTVTYALVEDTSNAFYQVNSVVYEAAEIALVDAVTNPSGTNGYAWLSSNPDAWLGSSVGLLGDQETQSSAQGQSTVSIGTLCTSGRQVSYSDITAGDLQPIWSQSDADAGRDPCQPELVPSQTGGTASTLSDASTPFYGVVPQVSATATGTLNGVARSDEVVEVSPGQSVTVTLEFFSTQPLSSDVNVAPTVVGYITGNVTSGAGTPGGTNIQPVTGTALISLSQITNESRSDAGTDDANNGDMLQVTITASSTPFSGMYVVEFGGGFVPLLVTEGDTWQ